MKHILGLLIALLSISNFAFSQSNNDEGGQSPEVVKDVNGKEVNKVRKPVAYPYVSDRDVKWSMTVWERIDLRQKKNLPYYYPIDTNSIDVYRRSLYDVLVKGIKTGKITDVYGDSYFLEKKSYEDISNITSRIDTLEAGIDELNNGAATVSSMYLSKQDVKTENITEFRIKGIYFFNKRVGEVQYRLLAIAPVGEELRNPEYVYDTPPDRFEMFWVKYSDAREVLHNARVFTGDREDTNVSFDDLLNAHDFSSVIYKEDNVYNDRAIQDYIKSPKFQLLKGEKIKQEIRDYESDLWVD